MRKALLEAKKAERLGEVPVGTIIVKNRKIISKAHNLTIKNNDPSAHAEIIALRKAAKSLKNYRLNDTIVFTTIEPCPMCAGAMLWARVKKVVFGAKDSKSGALGSKINLIKGKRFNHKFSVVGGVLEKECAGIMKRFFKKRRGA